MITRALPKKLLITVSIMILLFSTFPTLWLIHDRIEYTYSTPFYLVIDIISLISSITLIVYCLLSMRRRVNSLWYISFCLYAMTYLGYFLCNYYAMGTFHYTLTTNIVYALIFVLMMIINLKQHASFRIIGIFLFCLYLFLSILVSVQYGFSKLDLIYMGELLAFYLLFHAMTAKNKDSQTQQQNTVNPTDIKSHLVFLKSQYESGSITEEQYTKMKADILKNL